jgi:autotransporter-associated beta strand protein
VKKFFFVLIVLAMVSSRSAPAFAYPAATDRTWNGGGTDSNWQTAANWGGTAPSAGDALTFSGTTQLSPVNNFDEGTTFTGILINTGSGAFVTSGNGITVTGRGNGTVTGEWAVLNNEQSNSNTQTIGNKLTLSGSLSIECNSSTSLLKLTGDIVNNGVQTLLVKGAAGGVEIDGVISGSGGLQIGSNASGTNYVTLTNANTYTGMTTINAGVLNIQNGSALGTVDKGTSVLNSGAALQIQGGIITLAEALTLNGTGISNDGALRSISGNNNYTGLVTLGSSTRINSDTVGQTLTLSNAGTITGVGFGLTVGGTGNTTINSVIGTTSGTLTKDGTGTLTLSGVNTYTGPTAINAGTVTIGGATTFASKITAVAGTTLNLGTNTLTLTAGTAPLTTAATTILGTTLASDTTFGRVVMTAGVPTILSTTLAVSVGGTITNGQTFLVMDQQAGGGALAVPATITSDSPIYTFTGAVNATNKQLTLTANRITNYYAAEATGGNGRAAATQWDAIASGNSTGDALTVVNALNNLTPAQASAAFNSMVPEIDAGVINTSTTTLNNFVGVAMDRVENVMTIAKAADSAATGVSSGEASKVSGIWGKGYGSYLTQGTRNNIAGYDAWNAGTALGIDRLFYDCVTLGISGGWAYGNVDSAATNNANTNINSAQTTIYGWYSDQNHPYFIDAAGSFAYNWYNGSRDINVGPTINRTAKGKYGGQQYGAYLGGGYKFDVTKNIEFTPLISLQWNHLSLNSYTETGADALNLAVNRQNYDQLQSGLGARIAAPIKCKWGTFTPEAHGKWFYDFIGDDMAVTSNFNGGGGNFGSNGCKPALNSFNVGGQVIFDFKNDVSIIGNCDTEMKNQFFGIYGSLTLRYDF